jgi:hypothetical protein
VNTAVADQGRPLEEVGATRDDIATGVEEFVAELRVRSPAPESET